MNAAHFTLLVGGDDGARAALAPLAAAGARFDLPIEGARILVAGTSQSDEGFRLEAEARRKAARAGVPVVCIEDFPGNYRDLADAPTRLLVLEGVFSERVYRERLGDRMPPSAVVPPARYDALRGRAPNPGSAQPPYRVLWAGQPETDSCLATLRALAAFLARADVELLFRAHPRDRGHPDAYRALGLRWQDRTRAPIEEIYAAPLDLVVTQYSSVAIEAGFLGVPSVHVLLDGAGADLLARQKGYRVPMACEAGAAFLVDGIPAMGLLDTALRDVAARRAVLARFAELYRAGEPQSARLAECVAGIMR